MRKLNIFLILLLSFNGFSQTDEIDSLTIELAFRSSDVVKIDTSIKLIEKLYEIKAYDKAIKYIIESEKLSSTLKYKKGLAEISYYKALIYAEKNDYINAISSYGIAKSLFKKFENTLGVAKVNNGIGLLEIKRGNYNKGLQFSLSALAVLEKGSLKNELLDTYKSLAHAYKNIHAYDKAMEFTLKAMEIQEKLNDPDGINESYRSLAKLYAIKKENRKAIEYYEKALDGLGQDNDSIAGYIYSNLGGEYLELKDYGNATKYLIKGYNINFKKNYKSALLITLNNLGNLNMQQNRFFMAQKQLLQAGEIAKDLDNKEELLKHYKLMKALDSTRGRFDKAFLWQRHYYDLKKQLNEAETAAAISAQQVIPLELDPYYEKEKTPEKKSIAEAKENNIQSDERYKRLQIIFYALLMALAIVSTFLVLIYLKRKNTIQYSQELEEKNIKIELQNKDFLEQTQHLENVNHVKDKLFSIVSHDLKDSLSSINGFIDLLRDGSLTREEFDNLIPELSENANNASLLLFNLLNWSKSQMQSLDPKPSLFDVQEVFEDKIKLIEKRLENKGIQLIDHSLRNFAYADRSMVEIVIQNLLANAAKFCRNGDTITISNHINNGNCIISIADTGIGISEKNIGKLFKNDSSFTTMGTKNEKGTGLGLTICKELVDLNHGKIWVESTVNVGSTFYVQLPKSIPNNGQ